MCYPKCRAVVTVQVNHVEGILALQNSFFLEFSVQ